MKKISIITLAFLAIFLSCDQQNTNTMEHSGKANRLINSTSPYLLQHAYNPVDWYPWGEEALELAKKEDKVILVSIGYSSCHWCHVMERESFENDSIAAIMNEHFVNIKVDREERPDIDQIYMDAVQAMGMSGGWPLNVFLTPDQKPFYGGTYFPPDQWPRLLQSIATSFKEKRADIEKSAESFVDNLNVSDLARFGLVLDDNPFDIDSLSNSAQKMASNFDAENGGFKRAPKFPLPSDWSFLLRFSQLTDSKDLLDHTLFTLDKMAQGGIYDHMGGGFARYSVDAEWFAPHFEKMLYDNGQLMSLYANGYRISAKESYKEVIYETLEWLEREMTDEVEGGFFSAIDADSEGEEGKFYVWQATQLKELMGDEYEWYAEFYNITDEGNWEHGNNILHRSTDIDNYVKENGLDRAQFVAKLNEWNSTLLNIRNNRIKPGTDTKMLTGWNGLMLQGLLDAYGALGDDKFLDLAVRNGEFLASQMSEDGELWRSKMDGQSTINGYLEDYAYTIGAFISLYESTFNEEWLEKATTLTDYAIENFLDESENLFFYTSDDAEELIARKKEILDNVIPSSNSQMAINLHKLGIIMDRSEYKDLSDNMIRQVLTLVKQEPGYMSHWAELYTYKSDPTAEIIIVGDEFDAFGKDFAERYVPNKIIMGAKEGSDLPLFENRYTPDGKTTVYVCYNKTCKLPVYSVEEALKQLEE